MQSDDETNDFLKLITTKGIAKSHILPLVYRAILSAWIKIIVI